MIAAEIEPALLDRRHRARRPRHDQGGLGRALCRVLDLSREFARLQTYSSLRRGSTVWLTIPGLGQRAADVVWADDFDAGCQFREPLGQMDLDRLAIA